MNGQIAVLNTQIAALPAVFDPGEIIIHAEVPPSPSSPKHTINLAMGLFLGVFFGVVAAFIRDRTDERIGGRADLEQALDAPVLAAIPTISGRRQAVGRARHREAAEEPGRGGVSNAPHERDGHEPSTGHAGVRVASPTLGDGKSTTVANLAVVLSHADNRILADLGRSPATDAAHVLRRGERARTRGRPPG